MPNQGLSGLLKEGTKHVTGLDEAVVRNIDACRQLSAIVRTSLGPNGMNKMIVNHLGRLFVTSDAATIVRELEVIHPAAKIIVMASQTQEREVGDGTGLVVAFAGELLDQAEKLLRMGLHTSEIVQGTCTSMRFSPLNIGVENGPAIGALTAFYTFLVNLTTNRLRTRG